MKAEPAWARQRRPSVSVVMPFFNPPSQYFREAIDSVLEQSYTNWQLILVNDGSDEPATEIAAEYCRRFPRRIETVCHASSANLGPHASRRLGFQCSTGELLALLDADDVWLPNKLTEQIEILCGHPNAALIYGNSLYWWSWRSDERGDATPNIGVSQIRCIDPPHLVAPLVSGRVANPAVNSILARRDAIAKSGALEENFPNYFEDQVMLISICMHYQVVVCPQVWDYYRQHDRSQMSNTTPEIQAEMRSIFLQWIEGYMDTWQLSYEDVREIVHREVWKLEHPLRARLRRYCRRLLSSGVSHAELRI